MDTEVVPPAADTANLIDLLRSFSNPHSHAWSSAVQGRAWVRMHEAADLIERGSLVGDNPQANEPTNQDVWAGPFRNFGGRLALVITDTTDGGGYKFVAGDPSPSGRHVGWVTMPDPETLVVQFDDGGADLDGLGWDPARLRSKVSGRNERIDNLRQRLGAETAKAMNANKRANRFKRTLTAALDMMVRWAVENIDNDIPLPKHDLGDPTTEDSK